MSSKARRHAAALSVIARLAEAYPNTFSVYEPRRRPLKGVIGNDLVAAGTFTSRELGAALGLYCSSRGYLRALRPGAARIDLAGTPAGVVTPAEAQIAAERLCDAIKRAAARKAAGVIFIKEDGAGGPGVRLGNVNPRKARGSRLRSANRRQ